MAKWIDFGGVWPTATARNGIYSVTVNVPAEAALSGAIYPTYAGIQRNDQTYSQLQSAPPITYWSNILLGTYQVQMPRFQSVISNIGSLMESPEERAAWEKGQAARKAAEMRAERLLFTILKPSQVKQYSDDGYFDTDINGRIYRLHKRSRSMNVELIEAGKPKITFCAHPENAHSVPVPDVLLSQLLMLQADEPGFLRVANRQVMQ